MNIESEINIPASRYEGDEKFWSIAIQSLISEGWKFAYRDDRGNVLLRRSWAIINPYARGKKLSNK